MDLGFFGSLHSNQNINRFFSADAKGGPVKAGRFGHSKKWQVPNVGPARS